MVAAAFAALMLAPPAALAETVRIKSCYDGGTCRASTAEKIRLACIDTPELRGKPADLLKTKACRDCLRSRVAELFVDGSNVQ